MRDLGLRNFLMLLHKGGEREDITNWRPICLLNVAYKIIAKALQRRLQMALPEVISTNQTAFLQNRYILDNVLLLHETITWAQDTNQDMFLLKLDFLKAYDTVSWTFLLQCMQCIGFPQEFISLVTMLLLYYRIRGNHHPFQFGEECARAAPWCHTCSCW
jgi:hypothetical protein